MRIFATNNIENKQPVFHSCIRSYYRHTTETPNIFDSRKIQTFTYLFRNDLNWEFLLKYFRQHFYNKEKVNTYSLACSDGSEAYSYVIAVLKMFPEKLHEKFLPVYASDIDNESIKAAKSGRLNIYPIEYLTAEQKHGIDISKYFIEQGASVMIDGDINSESDTLSSYKPIRKLSDSIKFKQSDILSEIKKIKDDGNSIIMCRNVFPYLNHQYISNIVQAAKENLKDGSLFIVGDYDYTINIDKYLLSNGFFRPCINSDNIFQHGSSKKHTDKLYSGYLI